MIQIIFCGACTSQKILLAERSVEFLRPRKNYARSAVQAFSHENPVKRFSFESVSKYYFDTLLGSGSGK